MQSLSFVFALAALLTSTLAAPVIEERDATVCGRHSYSAWQVDNAAQQACDLYSSGSTAGGYPHAYNNFEGFSFPIDGSYLEFPLLSRGVYTGGSPGADRVIITTDCDLAGEITHTGASGNNFVGCDGTE